MKEAERLCTIERNVVVAVVEVVDVIRSRVSTIERNDDCWTIQQNVLLLTVDDESIVAIGVFKHGIAEE